MLKLLSHPGALALAIVWLHFRTQRMESRIEMLAQHFGAPQPTRKKFRGPMLMLLSLILAAFS